MQIHELKCVNPYFMDIWNGRKNYEIRKDDRSFKIGDILWLREWLPDTKVFGAVSILAEVISILPKGTFEGLKLGYCALGIRVIHRENP